MDSEKVIRSLRLQLLIERIAIAVIALTVVTTWAVGQFRGGPSIILVDGKAVACVPTHKDAEVVLHQIKTKTGCNPEEVRFQQEVRVARAPRDARPISRHKALVAVKDAVCPIVARWSIIVNGKPLVAVPDQKVAAQTLELAKMKFGSQVKNLAEEPQFKEEVAVDIAAVPVSVYCRTADQAVERIFSGTPTTMSSGVYTVKNGDLAIVIADRHGISLEELKAANPGVNLDRLSIGDKINIKAPKQVGPKLTVVVRDQSEKTETIPAPIQRVSSATLFTGESVQLSPGKPGQRRVTVATIYENGRKTNTEVVSEDIIKEPSPRRIALGIKTRR